MVELSQVVLDGHSDPNGHHHQVHDAESHPSEPMHSNDQDEEHLHSNHQDEEQGAAGNKVGTDRLTPLNGANGHLIMGHKTGAKRKAMYHQDVSPHNWLRLDGQGNTHLISTGKYKLAVQLLGVQPRDLRLLDPRLASALSPIAILVRENSIVVNLFSIRCIITQDYVLVVNPEDAHAAALIQELRKKLRDPTHLGQVMLQPAMSRLLASTAMQRAQRSGKTIGLSFELKVLEICLEKVVSDLGNEVQQVASVLLPILDKMAKRVVVAELELIRRHQTKLNQLTMRLLALKELAEKFLQNDEWMYKLSLNAVAAAAAIKISRAGSVRGSYAHTPIKGRSRSQSKRASLDGGNSLSSLTSSSSSSSSSSDSLSPEDQAEIAVVEMMLEAYQMQMEKIHNKVKTLDNAILDAQSMVHIRLNVHRNRLTNVDLWITAFNTALIIGASVSGLFGVNLFGKDPNGEKLLVEPCDGCDVTAIFDQVALAGASLGPLIVVFVFIYIAIRTGFM